MEKTDSKLTVFLDVQYEGMKVYLQDFGWNVKTITGVYGSSTKDRHDDNVMAYAEANKDSIIITQDQELVKRLKNKGHNVIGIDMSDLARQVNETLKKDYD